MEKKKKETNWRTIWKGVSTISLVVNVVLISYLGYTKRVRILEKIDSLFGRNEVTQEQLMALNNTFIPAFTDSSNDTKGELFKILIIGNSLSRHEIVEEIGWTHVSGMAATSEEKDFAHLIFAKLEEKLPDSKICLRISTLAQFERNPLVLSRNTVDSLVAFTPNVVIFQLGENVDERGDLELFRKRYVELVGYFKEKSNPLTICTTPFFPSLVKTNIVELVALESNSYLVDLSHLPLLDREVYAQNERNYKGDKSKWSEGVGSHPGDLGMAGIAQQIFITINAALSVTH